MKRKSLILSLASLVLIVTSLIMLGVTYGWGADLVNLGNGTISVGDLRYTQTGSFVTDGTIVHPMEELIDTNISIDNQSSIESQLRVKITYTKITNPTGDSLVIEEDYVYTDDTSEHISVIFDSAFTYDSGYWYSNGTTGVLSANSGNLAIISSIIYDGENTNIDYVGQDVAISVTIEVKQNDNVTWTELVGYDFSTGNPAS